MHISKRVHCGLLLGGSSRLLSRRLTLGLDLMGVLKPPLREGLLTAVLLLECTLFGCSLLCSNTVRICGSLLCSNTVNKSKRSTRAQTASVARKTKSHLPTGPAPGSHQTQTAPVQPHGAAIGAFLQLPHH